MAASRSVCQRGAEPLDSRGTGQSSWIEPGGLPSCNCKRSSATREPAARMEERVVGKGELRGLAGSPAPLTKFELNFDNRLRLLRAE